MNNLKYSYQQRRSDSNVYQPFTLNSIKQLPDFAQSKEMGSFTKGYNIFIKDPIPKEIGSNIMRNPDPVVEPPISQRNYAYYVNVNGSFLPYYFSKRKKN